MRTRHLNRRLCALAALVAVGAIASAQDDAADAKLLVDVLQIRPGVVVADIGAGDGALTIPVSRAVSESGHIYATELGGGPLERLRRAIASAGLKNVDIIEGHPLQTNLPRQCCDAIFVRNVYHHFGDPPSMNKSLWESLKPGGRLAIIDFAPNGEEASSPADRANRRTHGVAVTTVERELREAGFEPIAAEHRQRRTFLVVVRKPG